MCVCVYVCVCVCVRVSVGLCACIYVCVHGCVYLCSSLWGRGGRMRLAPCSKWSSSAFCPADLKAINGLDDGDNRDSSAESSSDSYSSDDKLSLTMRTKVLISDTWRKRRFRLSVTEQAFVTEIQHSGSYDSESPFQLSTVKLKGIMKRLQFVTIEEQGTEWLWVDSERGTIKARQASCEDVSGHSPEDLREVLRLAGTGDSTLLKLWEMDGANFALVTSAKLKVPHENKVGRCRGG
jgi:hypothetical protein